MKYINTALILFVAFIATITIVAVSQQTEASGVSTPVATMATSSTIQVGPGQVKTIFATQTYCAARIIGTVGTAIQISLSSTITPTALVGLPIAASSTTVLPSNTHACGAITAYATASTTISLYALAQ